MSRSFSLTKHIAAGIGSLLLLPLLLPAFASAHEMHAYTINGVEYEIEIGFINEPNIVDDPNGIHVEIYREGKALIGAQDNLQVELNAGGKQKTLELEPAWGEEGVYLAHYTATVPTTVTASLVGTLEGVKVSLPYTCAQGAISEDSQDTKSVAVSDGVTQTLKSGGYGCPIANGDLGFPEKSASNVDLAKAAADANTAASEAAASAQKVNSLATIALVLSLVSLGVGAFAVVRRK